MSNPKTRTMAPATKPVGREDATPRYGNGSVNTYTAIGTAIYNKGKTNYQLNKFMIQISKRKC
jgi:hypothetical protein